MYRPILSGDLSERGFTMVINCIVIRGIFQNYG